MARCPSVSFPLEAAAISPQPCSLCFSCSPWTFRSIPCAHQHSLAVLQAEVRCSPPPPAAVWGCTAGWAPPGSPRCPQPCPHSPAVPVLLAAKGPYLDLLPKQFVAGGCCLLSVAAAMLLGSRPGTWDPERLKEKGVKETITAPLSSTLLPPFPPTRKETQKHNLLQDRAASVLLCRTLPALPRGHCCPRDPHPGQQPTTGARTAPLHLPAPNFPSGERAEQHLWALAAPLWLSPQELSSATTTQRHCPSHTAPPALSTALGEVSTGLS